MDEFNIRNLKKFNTLAASGSVIKKPEKGKESRMSAKQIQYCSGVGKGMHMMHYSQPDTYNAVRYLARHMMRATQVHYNAMLRMMKYVYDTTERGLVLNPTQKHCNEGRDLSCFAFVPWYLQYATAVSRTLLLRV
jgi:hypothetical protein